MAGLLKQLQKGKGGADGLGHEVVVVSADAKLSEIEQHDTGDYDDTMLRQLNKNATDTKQLLDDLLDESKRLADSDYYQRQKKSRRSVVLESSDDQGAQFLLNKSTSEKRKSATRRVVAEGETPDWMTSVPQSSPNVELLAPLARAKLNEVLPADDSIEIDLATAVKQAVELAADELANEARFTKKDLELTEKELLSLLTGKGPLEPLYHDPAVTDIFIDDYKSIKVIRRGKALETPFRFRSSEEYRLFVTSMLQSVDRALNLSTPIVDCVLNDEWRSRVNAIDSSVVDGQDPRICIRVPRLQQVSFYDILQSKTLPAPLAGWLAELVALGEANILVIGPTGSGKTVMTTALLSALGANERVITIEDVPEIFVSTAHLEKLVSRPANAQGEGEVSMSSLLKAALRRAPHRIVVGEIRDEEGRLFLKALETGHAGSIATLHAETPSDGLWRLLDVVSAYEKAPQDSIMRRIGRSLHIIICVKKVDGKPCVVEVAEVGQAVNGEFAVTPLVQFNKVVNGKREWKLVSTRSHWMDILRDRGMALGPGPGLIGPEV